jgi:signal transduction histidine kinase/ligand-binding sensor domain-containing protein/DNA-binding response OmpR family regulator
LTLALLFSSVQPLAAQEKLLPVLHFQQVKGLPPVLVYSHVVRDSFGFVWVGTVNGLCRYDGYNVKEYRSAELDPYSLPSKIISSLYCDSRKRLWVGTSTGKISVYDHSRDRLLNLRQIQYDSSKVNRGYFGRFLEDCDGNIWCTMEDGIIRIGLPVQFAPHEIDSIASNVSMTVIPTGTATGAARSLIARDQVSLIAGTDSGIIAIDRTTLTVSRPRYSHHLARRLDSLIINCLALEPDGTLWVGTKTEGLYRFDRNRGTARNFRHNDSDPSSIKNDDVHSIELDPHGNLWVATYEGVDLFSLAEGRCIPYLTYGSAPGTGPRQRISIDCTGTVWFSTGAGVHWLSPRSLLLPHYGLKNTDWRLRSFESVERSKDGAIWCFSGGYLLEIETATKTVLSTIDVYGGKSQLFYETPDRTVSLLDGHGNFWYAAYDRGLYKVNLRSRRIDNYDHRLNRNSVGIRSIAEGPGDSLWIGTEPDGLSLFDPAHGTFLHLGFSFEVVAVLRARDSSLWISTEGRGLIAYQRATGQVTRFVHNASDPHSLSDDVTRVAYEDPTGRIWVGTGKGINVWDPAHASFIFYPNPPFDDALFALPIGQDAKGRVWIRYVSHGLSLFDPVKGRFTNLDSDNGLCGSPTDMQLLDDGKILLTGTTGVNIIHPDSLDYDRRAPPLVITQLRVNDTLVIPLPSVVESHTLQLSYDKNVLEFMFAAIDIDAPQLVEYAYRLEGLEPDWIKPVDRRYVRYTALGPGGYTFRVRATSSRGDWPEREIAFAFSIAPPWWRSLWAYGFYLSLGTALLVTIYRVRLNQARLKDRVEMEHFQAERIAEVDRLKSRFFANISHEFRTPLTLILGPAEQAIESTQEPSTRQKLHLIKNNTERLHTLVNQLLDFSQLESGTMKLQVSRNDVVEFLRRTVMSFESWAERKKINLDFQSEIESASGHFDRDKLEKILNNLISNSLKFTQEGGTVSVSLVCPKDQSPVSQGPAKYISRIDDNPTSICVGISDTGPGISAEHLPRIFDRFYRADEKHTIEGTGIGLALTKELVELHRGQIAVQSTPGKGSVFSVTFPIEKSAYRQDEIIEPPPQGERLEHPPIVVSHVGSGDISTPQSPDGKPIVLVVEDNADLRNYIREFLGRDFAVHEAEDGKEGYDLAIEMVPDIVLSDLMMPKMDGMELCRALKQDVRTSHVPVILLTARAGTESKIVGLETGADDYVTKPFDSKELIARVRNLIEQRRTLRAKFSAGVLLKPGEVAVTSLDDALLKKIMDVVEKNLGDEDFGVDELASEACLSRRHLGRKLHALTNLTPAEFVQYMRLQRARELLEKNAGSVTDIAFQVGFRNPTYFSVCFHARFGVTPSEVRHQNS